MIFLKIETNDTEATIQLDLPDKPGEVFKLAELAMFALYLEIAKERVTDLASKAISRAEGYDLTVPSEYPANKQQNA